jgi:hypothetical protein
MEAMATSAMSQSSSREGVIRTDPVYPTGMIRAEITQQVRSTDVPTDYCMHVIYFHCTSTPATGDATWTTLASNIQTAFTSGITGFGGIFTFYGQRGITVKLYNMADAKPRPELGFAVHTPTTWESSPLAPREVALCMSFYSGRNLRTTRGRLYVGPFPASYLSERPSNAIMQNVVNLGQALKPISVNGSVWSIYSVKDNLLNPATDAWCNDVWDGMSTREGKESTRVHVTL